MQFKLCVVVILLFCCVALCNSYSSCNYTEHQQPIPVFNSKYTVSEEGQFCCPLHHSESECIPDEEVLCHCLKHGLVHGLVDEPCHHCKTCAKGPGELCGGPYGALGRCADGLVCESSSFEFDFLDGKNITSFCGPPVVNSEYERCGGEYGFCEEGTVCTNVVPVQNVWRCLSNQSVANLKKSCFKDCNGARFGGPVCGTDGRMYQNVCYLRQQRCGRDPTMALKRANDNKPCESACPDISVPDALVSFSPMEVHEGAKANISCGHGHTLYYRDEPFPKLIMELSCFQRRWVRMEEGRRFLWIAGLTTCVNTERLDWEKKCSTAAKPVTDKSRPTTTAATDQSSSNEGQNIGDNKPTRSNEA